MNINVNRKFVEVEHGRSILAEGKKIQQLEQTYYKRYYGPSNLNTEKFWDSKIESTHALLKSSPIYKHKLRIISKYLVSKSGSLLDIGVGYGDLEQILSKISKNLLLSGIDISGKSIDQASRKYVGNFKAGSVLNIPFGSNTFDFVTCLDVLEHIPANRTFVAYNEIRRVLKKNGVLIVTVPLNENLDQLLLRNENPNGHMRIYTPRLISTELEIAGFKIFKTKLLSAFGKFYILKSLLISLLPFLRREPNLGILFAHKK